MNTLHDQVIRGWAKLLHPDALKSNLIVASLFLSAYETLRSSIIQQIRNFYWHRFNEKGDIISPKYETDVLSLDKSPLRASLLWLKSHGAVDESDIERVQAIRRHRNELAHDLPKFLATVEAEVSTELLGEVCRLVTKIDRWWIREVEIPINPDFDGLEVADEDIKSGRMLFLQLILQIAAGDGSPAYYEEFVKQMGKQLQPRQ